MKNCWMKDSYVVNINNQTINSENCVKLLGIKIDNTLSFSKHISTLCKRASNQLNAIGRIQKYMGFKEKEVLINSLSYLILIMPSCVPLLFFKNIEESWKNTRANP